MTICPWKNRNGISCKPDKLLPLLCDPRAKPPSANGRKWKIGANTAMLRKIITNNPLSFSYYKVSLSHRPKKRTKIIRLVISSFTLILDCRHSHERLTPNWLTLCFVLVPALIPTSYLLYAWNWIICFFVFVLFFFRLVISQPMVVVK